MSEEKRLVERTIKSLWETKEYVFVREGLNEGEQLILTDIPSPIPGLKLSIPQKTE